MLLMICSLERGEALNSAASSLCVWLMTLIKMQLLFDLFIVLLCNLCFDICMKGSLDSWYRVVGVLMC